MGKNLWIISELYYPEETSTGYFLTKIAEGLAQEYSVKVLCVQPTYSSRGIRAPSHEVRSGVQITRCRATTFNKDTIFGRTINAITISLSIFFRLLFSIRSNDVVLVVTNPPVLPFLTALACRLHGTRYMLLIHDVYPEVLVAAGIIRPNSQLGHTIRWFAQLLYRNSARIIVLGRDMKNLVVSKLLNYQHDKIAIIPNWADIEEVTPATKSANALLTKLELRQKFVVGYAGNMGRTHGLETIIKSTEKLAPYADIHFLFCGTGAKKIWLESTVQQKMIRNVTIIPSQPRSELSNLLNACDIAIISFIPGMAGVSVPSRMYNILAAGKPIIAVADSNSELALVIREENIGFVVPPDCPDKLIEAILQAYASHETLVEMGVRARRAAVEKYSFKQIINSYISLLKENI